MWWFSSQMWRPPKLGRMFPKIVGSHEFAKIIFLMHTMRFSFFFSLTHLTLPCTHASTIKSHSAFSFSHACHAPHFTPFLTHLAHHTLTHAHSNSHSLSFISLRFYSYPLHASLLLLLEICAPSSYILEACLGLFRRFLAGATHCLSHSSLSFSLLSSGMSLSKVVIVLVVSLPTVAQLTVL
jgi:hypothetical protein